MLYKVDSVQLDCTLNFSVYTEHCVLQCVDCAISRENSIVLCKVDSVQMDCKLNHSVYTEHCVLQCGDSGLRIQNSVWCCV